MASLALRSLGRLAIAAAISLCLSGAHAVETTNVMIDNFTFEPAQLTVKVGSTVTWKNRDDIPHTVVSAGKFKWRETDAFIGRVAAYQYLREEIIEMVGQEAYDQMVTLLERLYDHLVAGGIFIFDVVTPEGFRQASTAPPHVHDFDGNTMIAGLGVTGDMATWDIRIFEHAGADRHAFVADHHLGTGDEMLHRVARLAAEGAEGVARRVLAATGEMADRAQQAVLDDAHAGDYSRRCRRALIPTLGSAAPCWVGGRRAIYPPGW